MATRTPHCPFCDAALAVPPGTRPGHRVECPRCGESAPLPGGDLDAAVTVAPPAGAAAPPRSEGERRGANRRVAALVVGGMAAMALVGLGVAIWAQPFRRGLDTRPDPDGPGLPTVTAPADLDALRWLPAKTNLIVGVHYAELWHSPTGKALLTEPVRLAGAEVPLGALVEDIGLKPDEVDHLVLGARADTATVFLVARTRRAYDAAQVRKTLTNAKEVTLGGKTAYRFESAKVRLPTVAWFADDRTVVVEIFSSTLKDLPDRPAADLGRLPAALRALLTERMGREGPLWVAGDIAERDQVTLRLLFLNRADEFRELTKLRTFGLWVVLDPAMRLRADLTCRGPVEAASFEETLLGWAGDEKKNWTLTRDGERLTLDAPTSPAKVRRLISP